MSREKQIEEMALALSEGGCGKKCDCIQGDKFNCHLLYSASVLYNAGYRKATDVAREIFEEIENAISNLEYKVNYHHTHIPLETMTEVVNWVLHECVPNRLAELKQKYTEDGNENR